MEEELSNAVLLEIIGATIESEELSTTLGALYPVQTASVNLIEPSAFSTSDQEDVGAEPRSVDPVEAIAERIVIAPAHTALGEDQKSVGVDHHPL